mmetsp:Transcript_60870/g.170621  ORF Transcript_60870/g.170621 Transcript_60870/m.170621 type:complete len:447 (+) Transcript_60870:134-1474(+)
MALALRGSAEGLLRPVQALAVLGCGVLLAALPLRGAALPLGDAALPLLGRAGALLRLPLELTLLGRKGLLPRRRRGLPLRGAPLALLRGAQARLRRLRLLLQPALASLLADGEVPGRPLKPLLRLPQPLVALLELPGGQLRVPAGRRLASALRAGRVSLQRQAPLVQGSPATLQFQVLLRGRCLPRGDVRLLRRQLRLSGGELRLPALGGSEGLLGPLRGPLQLLRGLAARRGGPRLLLRPRRGLRQLGLAPRDLPLLGLEAAAALRQGLLAAPALALALGLALLALPEALLEDLEVHVALLDAALPGGDLRLALRQAAAALAELPVEVLPAALLLHRLRLALLRRHLLRGGRHVLLAAAQCGPLLPQAVAASVEVALVLQLLLQPPLLLAVVRAEQLLHAPAHLHLRRYVPRAAQPRLRLHRGRCGREDAENGVVVRGQEVGTRA